MESCRSGNTPAGHAACLNQGRVSVAVKRMPVDGAEGLLEDVKQLAPYKAAALTDGSYGYAVTKRGRRVPISWESMVNDDLGAFLEIPDRLARAARRTEEYFVTTLFVGTTGPLGTVYTAGNKNIVNATNAGGDFTADNPPLSVDALRQGIAVLSNQVDADGQPIMIEALTLMVPPALEEAADKALKRSNVEEGGAALENVAQGIARKFVNPYLTDDDAWYLFVTNLGVPPLMRIVFREMMRRDKGPDSELYRDTSEIEIFSDEWTDYRLTDWRTGLKSKP